MEILNAASRIKRTAHEAKKERRNGKVPGILYGKNIANMLFEIGEIELTQELSRTGEHGIVNINIDGDEHMALIKEVQRDPVHRKCIHIDLEALTNDTVVTTDVPLFFVGEDMVRRNGGILQKERNKVKVQCKGGNIPKSINVDVSGLSFGDTCRLADIEFSKEISILDDRNTVIAAVTDGNTDNMAEATPQVEGSSRLSGE